MWRSEAAKGERIIALWSNLISVFRTCVFFRAGELKRLLFVYSSLKQIPPCVPQGTHFAEVTLEK